MDSLNLDNVEPSTFGLANAQDLREDTVVAQQDLLLEKNAPEWDDGCFSVPKII